MAYGTVKVDNITFDNGGSDQNVTVSGLYRATTSGVTLSGTIAATTVSGVTVIGSTTVSGATVTGTIANFTSGNFSNIISSAATMSGALIMANQQQIRFREAVGNGVNHIALQAPAIVSADQTITLPDQTGTVITTGDNGSVSSTMLATNLTISAAAGTAAAPSIAFTGDPNTGIYSPGADQLAVSTGGTGRLFVAASGFVGIGASPALPFDVATADDTGVRLRATTNGVDVRINALGLTGNAGQIGTWSNNPFVFRTNNTERLRITSAGLVGIGTSSPQSLFTVGTNNPIIELNDADSAADNKRWQFYTEATSLGIRALTDASAGGGNLFTFNRAAEQVQSFQGSKDGVAWFHVDNSTARVGIGTTSPSVKLEVSGTTSANEIRTTDGTITGQWYQDSNGYSIFGTVSNHPQVFRTNSTERLRIDSIGNVGIGTTSPVAPLHVVSASAGANSARFSDGINSTLLIGHAATNLVYLDAFTNLGFYISGTERARIDSSGRLLVGTNTASGSALLQVAGDAQIQSLNGGPLAGFRNRIINGDMRIDQRNGGASITPGASLEAYSVDRWKGNQTLSGKYTLQQNAGSITPPSGFKSYVGATSLSGYSVLTGDTFLVLQEIEGFNSAHFGFGTATAATITLSFWVRSSLTGSFGGGIANGAQNRSYVFSYTINAANTWEYKTVTILGDTSGTWLSDNGSGIKIRFGLGSGSTFSTTAGSWQAGNFVQPSSTASVVGTNGATFYLTGVQLEPGPVATPFEHRPIGTELALCQRYYEVFGPMTMMFPWGSSTQIVRSHSSFAVTKRAVPTITMGSKIAGSGSASATSISTDGTAFAGTGSIQDVLIYTNNTASSEL